MGRTVLPITLVLREEEESWKEFRRALRKEDREHFDGIFASARYHSAACSLAARPLPMEAVLVCVLLEQRRELRELSRRLAEAERRLCLPPGGGEGADAAERALPLSLAAPALREEGEGEEAAGADPAGPAPLAPGAACGEGGSGRGAPDGRRGA